MQYGFLKSLKLPRLECLVFHGLTERMATPAAIQYCQVTGCQVITMAIAAAVMVAAAMVVEMAAVAVATDYSKRGPLSGPFVSAGTIMRKVAKIAS